MANRIDLNTAPPHILTQLPGVSKDIAYRIVNYRKEHGLYTTWDELVNLKGFPAEKLAEVQERAILGVPSDVADQFAPPHRLGKALGREKKPAPKSNSLRSTRGIDRARQNTGPRH